MVDDASRIHRTAAALRRQQQQIRTNGRSRRSTRAHRRACSNRIADQCGIPEPEQVAQYEQPVGRGIDGTVAVDIQRGTQ